MLFTKDNFKLFNYIKEKYIVFQIQGVNYKVSSKLNLESSISFINANILRI